MKMKVKNKFEHLEYPDLPRLPVPSLEESCEQYLNSVKPLISPEEFEKTKSYVREFLETDAKRLFKKVVSLSKESPTSFLEGMWDTSYLTYRVPFPCNINPAFGMKDDVLGRSMTQRGASIATSAMNFFEKIATGSLTQDKERTTPLCMSQYGKLFGSTRIPKPGRDKYMEYKNSKHFIVTCSNYFFRVNVLDSDGHRLSEGQFFTIFEQLVKIATSRDGEGVPVGILTSQHRDVWARIYPSLRKENEHSLNSVESGLFLIALDVENEIGKDNKNICETLLCGGLGNRWYDKSLQFIISKDAKVGLNMEHSGFDGHTVLILFHNMYNDELKREIPEKETISDGSFFELKWNVSDGLVASCKDALTSFSNLTSKIDIFPVQFKDFGSRHMKKKLKSSPDAFVQMAYQLAYYKMYKCPGSTYESANTKRFYHGRTECIRSVTSESVNFTKTFCNEQSNVEQKEKSLRIALDKHVQNVRLAKTGKTPSRLLFALKNFSRQSIDILPDYEIPKIFTDPVYGTWGTDLMSTSNCSGTPSCQWFCFGPVASNGFGIGYVIQSDEIHIAISAFEKKAEKFAGILVETLNEMKEVLEKSEE